MRGKAKKILAGALAMALAVSVFAGCNNTGTSSTNTPAQSGSAAESGTTTPAQEYNGNDVSEHVDLVHYFIGDMPEDTDVVWKVINDKLAEDINATVTLKNIPNSDYQTKYSLTIGSGETIDVIYTGTWAYYTQEAAKGAFAEEIGRASCRERV